MIFPDVKIYSKLTIGTTVYEEDDLHKPYFTATASRTNFKSFAKDADILHHSTAVQPRKVKEFSEMEKKCSEALQQIEDRKYEEELLREGCREILKYGICFLKKGCIVMKG